MKTETATVTAAPAAATAPTPEASAARGTAAQASPATALAPSPFVPEVVEKPDALAVALAELNETKRLLTTSNRLLHQSRDELAKLSNYIQRIEKNPLIMVMSNLDGGSVLDDAGELLTQVTAAVRKQQANGSFTFTIKVKPFKADALLFVPEMKIKEPQPEMAKGVFYSGEHGELSRQDPRQRELALGKVSRADRSSTDDPDPYRDERPAKDEGGRMKDEENGAGAGGKEEDSEEDLAAAQRVIDESETFPSVSVLQRRLRWGFNKASRVISRLAKG